MNSLKENVISSTSIAFFAFLNDLCVKYKQMIDPKKDFSYVNQESIKTLHEEFEKLDEGCYLNSIKTNSTLEQSQFLTDPYYIKNFSAFLFLYDKFQIQLQLNLRDSSLRILMLASSIQREYKNAFLQIWDIIWKLTSKNKIIAFETFLTYIFLDIDIIIFCLILFELILKDDFSYDKPQSLVLNLHHFDYSLMMERSDLDALLFLNYVNIKFYHFLLTCPQNYELSSVQIRFTFIKEIYDDLPTLSRNPGLMLPLYYSSLSALFDFLPKEISTITYNFVMKSKSDEFTHDGQFLLIVQNIHNIPRTIIIQCNTIIDEEWSSSECFEYGIRNFILYNFVKNIPFFNYHVTVDFQKANGTVGICSFFEIKKNKQITVYIDPLKISQNDELFSPVFINFLKNFREIFSDLTLYRKPFRNAEKTSVTIFDSISKSFWITPKKNNSVSSSLSNLEFRNFFYVQICTNKDNSYIFLENPYPLYPIYNFERIIPTLMLFFEDIYIEDYDRSNKKVNQEILYFIERGLMTNIFYYFRPSVGDHQIHMYFTYFRKKHQIDQKYEYCLLIQKIIEFFISLSKLTVKIVIFFEKDFFISYMDSKDFQSNFSKLTKMVNKIVFVNNKKALTDSITLIQVEKSSSVQILIIKGKNELVPHWMLTDGELFILKCITKSFSLIDFHLAFNSGSEIKSFLLDTKEISYTCSSFHSYESYEEYYSILSQSHNHSEGLVRFQVSNFDGTVKTLLELMNDICERRDVTTDEEYNDSFRMMLCSLLFLNVKERDNVLINSEIELFKFCKTITGFDRQYFPINIVSYNLSCSNPNQLIEKLIKQSSSMPFNQLKIVSGSCLSSDVIPCFDEIKGIYGYDIKELISQPKIKEQSFKILSETAPNSSFHLLFCIKKRISKLQRKPIMCQIIKFLGKRIAMVLIYKIDDIQECLHNAKKRKCIIF